MRVERVPVEEGLAVNVHVWEGDGDAGDGAPFLLVHGLSSNLRLWDGVAERLAAAGHRVVAVDQRGHGQSDKPDHGYDFETLAADLLRVIEATELDKPVAAGQSWGANVVLDLAARHAARVRGIVAVDGGVGDLGRRFPTWEECAAAMAPPVLEGFARERMETGMRSRRSDWPESGIQGALACFEVRDDGTIAPWLTRERHMMILRELWQHRPSERYPGLEVNALLVPCRSGSGPWTAAKQTAVDAIAAASPRVRVRWADADHDVHAQHPELVAGLLVDAVTEGFFR